MIREQEFKHFYKSDLVHALVYTEKERKSIVLQLVLSAVLPLLLVPIFSVLYYETKHEYFLIPVIILLVGPPIYINKLLGDTIFYRNFKKKIIGKIIRYISPNLDYDNLNKVDDAEYDASHFFTNKNTIIYGDDHVTGTINGIKVQFSELLAEFRSKDDAKKADNKFQFRGLFFVAEFPSKFPCNVTLKTTGIPADETEEDYVINHETFDSLFYINVISGKENIRKTLTTNVVNAMLEIEQTIHNEFVVSFVDNKVYFGVSHDEDLFEPTLFHSMMNQDKMKAYFDDLFYPIYFIEQLTKEFK
mgnify:CR=1 FL=1